MKTVAFIIGLLFLTCSAFAQTQHTVSIGVKMVSLDDAKDAAKNLDTPIKLPPNLKVGMFVLEVTDGGHVTMLE